MLTVYTDGSCYPNPGPGGLAFAVWEGDAAEPMFTFARPARRTTNNRMEMLAIIRAMQWLGDRSAVICTDSRLCQQTITTWAAGWKARGWRKVSGGEPENLDLVELAHSLYDPRRHDIRWVRGHAGDPRNELVDQLAGEARLSLDPQEDACPAT